MRCRIISCSLKHCATALASEQIVFELQKNLFVSSSDNLRFIHNLFREWLVVEISLCSIFSYFEYWYLIIMSLICECGLGQTWRTSSYLALHLHLPRCVFMNRNPGSNVLSSAPQLQLVPSTERAECQTIVGAEFITKLCDPDKLLHLSVPRFILL